VVEVVGKPAKNIFTLNYFFRKISYILLVVDAVGPNVKVTEEEAVEVVG
jgi:hypothetical protein